MDKTVVKSHGCSKITQHLFRKHVWMGVAALPCRQNFSLLSWKLTDESPLATIVFCLASAFN